jgi:hypothetical protein
MCKLLRFLGERAVQNGSQIAIFFSTIRYAEERSKILAVLMLPATFTVAGLCAASLFVTPHQRL